MTLSKKTLSNNEGLDALNYLKNERGFTEEVINAFNVGYVPSYLEHQLRNRIITPVYDPYNRLSFLSTRVLRGKEFFHESINKSLYLFGLNIAKPNIIKYGKAIIVEGEFDTMFLHSNGINIAVAMSGTALSLFQVSILSRYCSDIYYVTDGDLAGKNSIKRALQMAEDNAFYQYGINIIPILMPDKKDPDDFIKENGRSAFLNLLKENKEKIYKERELANV